MPSKYPTKNRKIPQNKSQGTSTDQMDVVLHITGKQHAIAQQAGSGYIGAVHPSFHARRWVRGNWDIPPRDISLESASAG